MDRDFSALLDAYVKRAKLPLRSLARQSGIPHQTIYNWIKGSQPRLYLALPGDICCVWPAACRRVPVCSRKWRSQ